MRSEIVTRRTYNRPMGTRHETWEETCERASGHSAWLWRNVGLVDEREVDELRQHMVAKRSMLAGRTMWLGGTEVGRKRAASQFNCSFLRVATVHDVVDALWLLLQGCGVGFQPVPGNLFGYRNRMDLVIRDGNHPERGDPANQEHVANGVWTLRFGDSAEAWAKGWGKLIANKPAARTLVLDFTNIRAPGGVLAGYGWTCSGSANLRKAMELFHAIMNQYAGKLLPFSAIHDTLNLMGTVLSSRRSAQIALRPMDEGWREFAGFKAGGEWWRGQSNNSLLMEQWNPDVFDAMVEAGGSEPGIVNVTEAKRRAPWFAGTNPCLLGLTKLVTRDGLRRIDSLDTFETWDGSSWVKARAFFTGVKPVVRITLSNGQEFTMTADHRIATRSLVPAGTKCGYKLGSDGLAVRADGETTAGDSLGKALVFMRPDVGPVVHDPEFVKLGFMQGDGARKYRYANIGQDDGDVAKFMGLPDDVRVVMVPKGLTDLCIKYLANETLPNREISEAVITLPLDKAASFLRGLYSANGCVLEKHGRVVLKAACRQIIAAVQQMLTAFGIRSYVTTNKSKAVKFANGTYTCRESYDLNITSDRTRFREYIGFIHEYKNRKLDVICERETGLERPVRVVSVEPAGEAEVYDFSMERTHWGDVTGFRMHNCGEILLSNHSFCNLTTINQSVQKEPNAALTRLMARANYRQTCVDLRDGVLQTVWHETNAMLRLCGVSGTGWTQAPWVTPEALRMLRAAAWDGARSMADELGMPHPAAVTTIKPEGTASKIMNCAEGIHRPLGRYILNRVVFPKGPLATRARDHGYEVTDHPHDASACLVTLPVEYPGAELVDTEPAVRQLDRYAMFMEHYVDHNASVTIRYRPEEVKAVKRWMKVNWDKVVGVSFLPYLDPTRSARDLGYAYLPQQVVTEAEFRKHRGRPFPLDETAMEPEQECAGGVCPVR